MVHGSSAGYSAAVSPLPSPLPDAVDEASPSSADPLLSSAIQLAQTEAVFPLIQRIKATVEETVDTALSWDQFKSPAINFSVVRPLTVAFSKGERPAISLIFALLVCRSHFVERSEDDLAFAAVNISRADLCELLAIKLLSAYGTAPGSLELLHVLTTTFNPFAGATLDMFPPEEMVDTEELKDLEEWGKNEETNALEFGIFTKAKRFVKSPLVQQVITAIYDGEVIYSPESNHALIQDSYKTKPVVELYDWRKRPFLDHHRLRVPHIRTRLEYISFATMLVLFLFTQFTYHPARLNAWELLFILWGTGFALDEFFAVLENGLTSHFGVAFNLLDSTFVAIFFAYLGLRIAGLRQGDEGLSTWALDTLSLAGCVLLPRVTISLLKDNVVLLALSKMVREFVVFMGLTVLTASGFLVTLRILSHGKWSTGKISWLLLRMHLGSAFLGFEAAQDFGVVFGPILMVVFAVLSQTLLLTILISLLTNTFSAVQANAETEILFQKALRTVERAKADPLSLYVTPVNTIALLVLFPARFIASPYALHKSQVYLCRLLNLPVLLFLALHVRATRARRSPLYLASQRTSRAWASLPRSVSRLGGVVAPLWEGTAEVLAERVFERSVTREGRRVASFDDEDEGLSSSSGSSTAKKGGSGSKTPTTSAAVEQAAAEQALSSSSSRRRAGPSTPFSPSKAKQPKRPAPERLASLTSPLARIFNAAVLGGEAGGGGVVASAAPAVRRKKTAGGKEKEKVTERDEGEEGEEEEDDRKEVKERLERIEEALKVLLGEVGRAEARKELGGVPLVSLTGEPEPSYAD
ncbi:hypothetical protein JCM8547_000410 [Rhodosporidiobolus lusitaniae]